MRKLHDFILSGSLKLSGGSSSEILSRVDDLDIHVVRNRKHKAPLNKLSFLYLHFGNKRAVEQVSHYVKQAFLLDQNIHEIFDDQSRSHQVYTLLSKLDKVLAVNDHYLKEYNILGLRQLSDKLTSLIY